MYRNKYTGRFSKLTLYRKSCLVLIGICALMPVIDFIDRSLTPQEIVYRATGHAEAAEISTIDDMKKDVLDKLAKCESGGNPDIAIVFDTNAKPSLGEYQWQPHSFQYYYQKQHGVKLTEKEAVIKALDRTEARALAHYVIFETDNGSAKDWVNCTRWNDLTPIINLIKSHD